MFQIDDFPKNGKIEYNIVLWFVRSEFYINKKKWAYLNSKPLPPQTSWLIDFNDALLIESRFDLPVRYVHDPSQAPLMIFRHSHSDSIHLRQYASVWVS